MTSTTSFGAWVRQRRKARGLTQATLAQRVPCSLITIKKLEADERRPSEQVAERLADELQISGTERVAFLRVAHGHQAAERLGDPVAMPIDAQPAFAPPPHNLPAQLTPLLGRESELKELQQLLVDPAVRLLTIVGPGGMGKTHLAIEAARQLLTPARAAFADGIYFVPLAALKVASSIVTAIADALHFSFADSSNLPQQLGDYLRPKHLLLVLDNFEHLLDGVPLVVQLLENGPGLKLLVTSRLRLQVRCEQRFPLAGLTYPTSAHGPPAALPTYSAVQLFCQQAQRGQPHFAPATGDWRAIAQICRQMEGMPLGILLAAAWIGLQTPTEIAAAITHKVDLVQSDWHDLPDRQKSFQAMFAHSWGLLDQRTQAVFAQLTIFRSGFTYAAAAAVTGCTRAELLRLIDLALLREDAAGRFDLHELVRQFVTEKLVAAPDQQAKSAEHHAAWYAAFATERRNEYLAGHYAAALRATDVEVENLRAAWYWAASVGQVAWLQPLKRWLNHYYDMHYRYQDLLADFAFAIEKLTLITAQSSTPSRPLLETLLQILVDQSCAIWHLGQFTEASAAFQRCLTLMDQIEAAGGETRKDRAFVLRELGRLTVRHDRQQARLLYQQSLALYQALEHRWGIAHLLSFLGELELNLGNYAAAHQWLTQCLQIAPELEERSLRYYVLNLLGQAALHQGQAAQAEEYQREALTFFQSIGEMSGIGLLLNTLSFTLVLAGQFDAGRALLAERQRLFAQEATGSFAIATNNLLAQVNLHKGDYETARQHAQTGLALARTAKIPELIGEALFNLGQLLLVEGHYTEAKGVLQESADQFQRIDQRGMVGWPLALLGYAERGLGNPVSAHHLLIDVLQHAVARGAYFPIVLALPALALCAYDQGQRAHAVELYTVAACVPLVTRSRWFMDMVGYPLAQTAGTLPPAQSADAVTAGCALDLWATAARLLTEADQAQA